MATIDPEKNDSLKPKPIPRSISFGSLPSRTATHQSNPSSPSTPTYSPDTPQQSKSNVLFSLDMHPAIPTRTLSRSSATKPQSPFPFPQPPRGYPLLASSMSNSPSLAIFRRFSSLNHLALLALQSELVALEHQYQSKVQADDMSPDPALSSQSTDMHAMLTAVPPNSDQREILAEITSKLHEYNQLLQSASATGSLSAPSGEEVRKMQGWLRAEADCGREIVGSEEVADGRGRNSGWSDEYGYGYEGGDVDGRQCPWAQKFQSDLVTLRQRDTGAIPQATSNSSNHGLSPSWRYRYSSDDWWKGATMTAGTLLAALFPVLAVYAMLYVEGTQARLGVIMGFAAGLGALVAATTKAGLIEIWATALSVVVVGVLWIGTVQN